MGSGVHPALQRAAPQMGPVATRLHHSCSRTRRPSALCLVEYVHVCRQQSRDRLLLARIVSIAS